MHNYHLAGKAQSYSGTVGLCCVKRYKYTVFGFCADSRAIVRYRNNEFMGGVIDFSGNNNCRVSATSLNRVLYDIDEHLQYLLTVNPHL